MDDPKGTLTQSVVLNGARASSNARADHGEPSEYSASNYPFDIQREVDVMTVRGCTQDEARKIAEKARAANPGVTLRFKWVGDVLL